MINDNVITAYPIAQMIQRLKSIQIVTENVSGRFFLSIVTPETTCRVIEFESLAQTTAATAKLVGITSGVFLNIISSFISDIQTVMSRS